MLLWRRLLVVALSTTLPFIVRCDNCDNLLNVGLKPRVPPHLGDICHTFSDVIDESQRNSPSEVAKKGEEVILEGNRIFYRTQYQEIPSADYKLNLTTLLKSEDGRETIMTKIFLRENNIKVTESMVINHLDGSQSVNNQRVIQFGYGSAPANLVKICQKGEDPKVKSNILAKIKEWYPDADISAGADASK
jgi:hypothetical protein